MSDWIVEAVLQFVNSPLWNVPVNNFIDDQCIFFDADDSEMKLEYTPVYKEFQVLIDGLLSSFIAELGVPTEEVITACRERSNAEAAKSSSKQPSGIVTVSSFLDYITYLTDFRSFKKLMERRNVELDVEASRALKRMQGQTEAPTGATAPPSATQETDEERDVRLAMQLSLQDAELIAKEAELQDAELQRALALSLAMERDRAQRDTEEVERQMRIAAAHAEKARLEQEAQLRLAQIEAERVRKVAELEQQALKERMENLVIHAERAATATQAAAAQASEASVPAPPPASVAIPEPAAPPAPVQQPLPEVQDVVRIATQPDVALPQPSDSSLAPLGRKGTFGAGFKPLPSIQPTFKELNSALVTTTSAPIGVQRPASLPAAPVITENKDQPSKEELEERARHMRQQRELLMAQRKANRATELANYSSGGKADPAVPVAAPTDERQKQMALEIARRFREDIVGEARKQQNASE